MALPKRGGYRDNISLKWIRSPERLARDFEDFDKQVRRTQRVTFNKIKTLLVNSAKANAPWQDQTGDARSLLHARYQTVSREAAIILVNVYLIHGVDYGVFLELANSGRFAIINDTLLRNRAKIESILVESLRDFR